MTESGSRGGRGSSVGGARAAAGLMFQAEVFAWWATRAIAGAGPGLGLGPRVLVEAVGCETGFPVDDVGVALSDEGFILVQAKGSMRRLHPRARDLRIAVDQLVTAMIGGLHVDGGRMRPVDSSRDRLMIVTNQDGSQSFHDLGIVCGRFRDLPMSVPLDAAATNVDQRRALTAFLEVVRSSWAAASQRAPSEEELREFLRVLEVDRLDFEVGKGAERVRCEVMLERASTPQPFSVLTGIGMEAARSRTWRRRDALMAAVGLGNLARAEGGWGAVAEERHLLMRLAPASAYLAGRDDLLGRLHEQLSSSRKSGPRVVALCGLGGVGKTALALSYAHRYLGSYGLVWQVPASDPVGLSTAYGELARYVGAAAGASAAVQEVHNALAARTRRWLLIFDDAGDPASLRDYLPPAGDGDIIVTSQDAGWPPAQQVRVDVLEAGDAAAFLVSRTGDTDAHAAAEVASMLGQLPLALEQAGAYIVATGCGLHGYAELFREHRTDLLVRGQPSDYRKTVATTWLTAFDQLQESAPDSITLLRLLACYGPYPVPLDILQLPHEDPLEEVTAAVAQQVQALLASKLTLSDAVAALSRYSLISIPAQGMVTVHELVQAVTRDQIPIAELHGWQDAAAALLRSALPEDSELPENWLTFRALTPHVLATLPAVDMRSTVQFLRHSGSYGAAVVVQEHVAEDVLDRFGPNDPRFVTEMGNLFYLKGESGNPGEARDGFLGLLHGLVGVADPKDPFILQLRSQAARWTGEAGDPMNACAMYSELMPVLEEVLGKTDSRTQMARFNFASMLVEAGEVARGRDLYADMVPVYEESLGLTHPDTLGVRANLAFATGKAGQPARAHELYAALLPVMERTLGPTHPKTLIDRANMAYMAASAGDRATAFAELASLVPILEQVHGPTDATTLAAKEFRDRLAAISEVER